MAASRKRLIAAPVDPIDHERLARYCKARGVTRADVIRQALFAKLDRDEGVAWFTERCAEGLLFPEPNGD